MNPKYLTLLLSIRSGVRTFRGLDAQIAATPIYSAARISWYLDRLRDWGLITWQPGRKETIDLTPAGQEAVTGLLLTRCGERVTGVYRIEWAENTTEDLCQ